MIDYCVYSQVAHWVQRRAKLSLNTNLKLPQFTTELEKAGCKGDGWAVSTSAEESDAHIEVLNCMHARAHT